MDIPNLSQPQPVNPPALQFNKLVLISIVVVALTIGFWLSRIFPANQSSLAGITTNNQEILSTDKISDSSQIEVGKIYGNIEKSFKDTAVGILEKGSINNEGTHILNREGGLTQRASLTSSAVDLDLFVGRKIEVKGETNASTKTAWLMDVGSVKVLE